MQVIVVIQGVPDIMALLVMLVTQVIRDHKEVQEQTVPEVQEEMRGILVTKAMMVLMVREAQEVRQDRVLTLSII
jgi:hypothetical protein